jgi:hypothetical protein
MKYPVPHDDVEQRGAVRSGGEPDSIPSELDGDGVVILPALPGLDDGAGLIAAARS